MKEKKKKEKKSLPENDELKKVIDELEDLTGEKINLRPVVNFGFLWFRQVLIQVIIIMLALVGFNGLLKAISFDYFYMLIIYIFGNGLIYGIISWMFYLLRKKLIFILHSIVTNLLLVASIILTATFIPHIFVINYYSLIFLSIIVVIANIFIYRTINKLMLRKKGKYDRKI